MPYLILVDAQKFSDFASAVFSAKEQNRQMREDGKTLMHAEIQIGNSTVMFAEAMEQWPPHTAGLFVYVEDADVSYKKALELGATTVMELSDQDYGRTCGIADPFGNVWWMTSITGK